MRPGCGTSSPCASPPVDPSDSAFSVNGICVRHLHLVNTRWNAHYRQRADAHLQPELEPQIGRHRILATNLSSLIYRAQCTAWACRALLAPPPAACRDMPWAWRCRAALAPRPRVRPTLGAVLVAVRQFLGILPLQARICRAEREECRLLKARHRFTSPHSLTHLL